MRKIFVLAVFFLFFGVAFAAPSSYVKKSANFCSYICLGKGGQNNLCQNGIFGCNVYIGVIFQQAFMPISTIPCDILPFIQSIFPSLLPSCGIIEPVKDIFIEGSVEMSSKQVLINIGTQTGTVTVRNTNDQPVTADIKISVFKLTSLVEQCSFASQVFAKKGDPGDSVVYSCTFTPSPGASTATHQEILAAFSTIGNYKIVGELSNFSSTAPNNGDNIIPNDYSESFFSVVNQTPTPISETGWILLPLIALLCLYIIGRHSAGKKKNK